MEIAERLEWFMKMLWCKYPVDLQEYDRSLTPRGDLADDLTHECCTSCWREAAGWSRCAP